MQIRFSAGLLAALSISAFIALPLSAQAEAPKSLGTFGAWRAYVYAEKNGKVCYAAALPANSLNTPKGRGPAAISVTHRTGDKSRDVVSVSAGFPFKKDGKPELDISGAKFDLYAQDSTAWTHNDKAVVQAMLKGKSVVAHSSPVKGADVADTFSLDGFAKAYAEIGKACGVK